MAVEAERGLGWAKARSRVAPGRHSPPLVATLHSAKIEAHCGPLRLHWSLT